MKSFKLFAFLALMGISLFAEEDPMGNMTIEYGPYDILEKENASSQARYYPQDYFDAVIVYVQDGNTLSRKGEYQKAIEQFTTALKTDSTYVFALNGLGNAYLRLKKHDLAEHYFRLAMKFGPNYAFPFNNLANLYVLQGKYDEAMPLLLKALGNDPNSAHINYNIGNIYLQKGQLLSAQSYYQKAIKFDNNFCNARYNLAITYWRLKREKDAIREYEKLVTHCPGHSKGVLNLAAFYLQNHEIDKALLLYNQAVVVHPDPEVYKALGHAYHNAGYAQKEIESYQKALVLNGRDQEIRYYLALSYYEQNMLFSAKEICEAILRDEPENQNALDLLKKINDQ